VLVLSFSIHSILFAQTPGPPSLAIGAGKVLYDKGTLDAELISSIIANKQDEIKNELASRLVLDKLSDESYVIQHFAKVNLDLLLKGRNMQVTKKELLRNASELMITAATLEFYLRVHRKTNREEFTNIISDVVESFNFLVDSLIVPDKRHRVTRYLFSDFVNQSRLKDLNEKLGYKDKSKWRFPLSRIVFSKKSIAQNEKKFKKDRGEILSKKTNAFYESVPVQSNGKFLPKPNYIFGFNNLKYITLEGRNLYLQNILLDLTYGVLTDNEFIQQLGLFANVEKGTERNERDNYLYFCSKINSKNLSDPNVILWEKLKVFEKSLKGDLSFLTKYQFILSQIKSSLLENDVRGQIDSIYHRNNLQKILDEIHVQLTMEQLDQNTCKDCDKTVFGDLLNLMNSDIATSNQDDDNWLYTVQLKILPALLNLNVSNKTQQSNLLKKVEDFKAALNDRLISNLLKDREKLYSKSLGSDILFSREDLRATLLKLISLTVNNFDQAETYEIIMNFITGLGNLSSNPVVKAISSTIIDAGEKYITVQKDSNRVSLDVESMAVDLYKQFSENSNRRLSMYFSVGINYNTPIGESIKINDTTHVKSYSFLSEKIGLKYNFIDRARRYGYFHPSQKRKPIVKDVHALLFGSGLLYQIKELSTAKNFSSPIIGLGLGITFLNDLDLNVNYAFPIEKDVRNSLLNVSFDIRIAEYLAALSKSKKSKKLNN
jgi:hypothetical protein